MSDLVERLRRAFDADSVAEKNLAIRAAYDFIAAMQADAAPALKPAVEVWRDAAEAYAYPKVDEYGYQIAEWRREERAAAVIEADRAAIIAAKDAEIAALKGKLAEQAEDNADLPTIAYFAGAADARDRLAALQAHADALAGALEEWMFRYYWRAEGMNTEQARIHANAKLSQALRAYEEFRR